MLKEVGDIVPRPPVTDDTWAASLKFQSLATVHVMSYPEPRGVAQDTTPEMRLACADAGIANATSPKDAKPINATKRTPSRWRAR